MTFFRRSCHLYSGAKSITNTVQSPRSIQEHLPYFVQSNARVHEVNINCSPDTEGNRIKYVINTKWTDDDERAAKRWRQLITSTPIPRSHKVEDRSSESGTSYAETMWGNISSVIDESTKASEEPPPLPKPNAHSSSSGNTSTSSHLVPLGEDRIPKEPPRLSSAGDKPTLSGSTLSEDPTSTLLDECAGPPWQNLLEMLSIRIIILEKVQTGIVRRQIDFEAPSDRNVASIYKLLEKKLPTLQKIQIYYTNSRINRRTDLTKLPAGDQRQFGDLASNKGTVIFVVATDGVRVF
ncbi:hypothetical protein Y032_0393g610 [Ancylostoma ceylanicum]|uniref:Uncharacterized protein n=2 Tax=Ancylostoma ceylanicum TaxID=53326 RepID=A0A016RRT5_9BILA|nr:hypothetical protein Y032_0393g610 [Ancylostoma ceylanicum]